jgi:hypothetical protein
VDGEQEKEERKHGGAARPPTAQAEKVRWEVGRGKGGGGNGKKERRRGKRWGAKGMMVRGPEAVWLL